MRNSNRCTAEVIPIEETKPPESRFDVQVKEAPGAAFFLGLAFSSFKFQSKTSQGPLYLELAVSDPLITVVNLFYGDVIFFRFDIEMRSYTDKHLIFAKKIFLVVN